MRLNVDYNIRKRLLDLAYHYQLGHLSSYFSSIDLINTIYSLMKKNDKFILSNGHAAVALYVVLEKYYDFLDAEELYLKHGEHPKLSTKENIYCSTGSLGMGLTVATGLAYAEQQNTIHCLISDGECYEGSVWESLSFIKLNNIKNIKIYVNANGYSAYDSVDLKYLEKKLKSFLPEIIFVKTTSFLNSFNNIDGHYKRLTQEEYDLAIKEL